jgi:predicted ArsR family transcriptional regulator
MDENMKTITCKELAKGLGCNYVIAAGIMSLLVKTGQAKVVAKVFHESGRGKPTRVYMLANKVKLNIPTTKPNPVYKLVGNKLIQAKYRKAV